MRIFFSSFIIILFAFKGYGQKLLTLEEAVNIALQRNTVLQKSVNSIDTYQSNVKAAYGDGTYVYTDKVWWAGGTR